MLPENPAENLTKEVDIRQNKIKLLKENGINPYAPKFDQTHSISQVREMEIGSRVKVAGRLIFRRTFGKFMFVQIADVFNKLQLSLSVNEIALDDYKFFNNYIDMGDYIGVDGEIYETKTGELTVRVFEYKLLSKAKLPLPEKFHGLTDVDSKYRQRYLDLISNEESRKVLVGRSRLVAFIRDYLQKNDFLEVETPILQGAVCGASAKPFLTKHNALDKMCNLRIAPEVYLKQVVCGGFPRVFEVAKCFRNEGMDASHLQEFTQVEWYASYWDFEDNIKFFTKFIQDLTTYMLGKPEITIGDQVFNLSGKFKRLDYTKAICEILGFDVLAVNDLDELKNKVIATKEFDADEYTRLYVTKLNGVDGMYNAETLNDNEWNEIKNLIKTIVKANKEGMPVPVQDLNPEKIRNITLKDKKVFKLNTTSSSFTPNCSTINSFTFSNIFFSSLFS